MIKTHNPAGIAGPFGHYDQGVEAVNISRLLHVSGQVGVAPDGSISDDIEAQIEQVWFNIEAVLAEAGMTTANIVRTITYILDADPVPVLAAARRKHLGPDCKSASHHLHRRRPPAPGMEGGDRRRRRCVRGRGRPSLCPASTVVPTEAIHRACPELVEGIA